MLRLSCRGRSRPTLLGLMLLVWLMAVLATASPAAAVVSGCRGDPIVFLSDGTRLHIAIEIDAALEDVQNVLYTVHAPPGVTVKRIIYNGNPGLREQVDFRADSPAGYSVDTVALVNGEPVPVQVRTRINGEVVMVDGLSGQTLLTDLLP